ncbi:MAG: hypothetical protein R2789_03130 [Microthrixaceae bacterium]
MANTDDVTDFDSARRLVHQAVDHFGDLHVQINNAGIPARPHAGEHGRGGDGMRSSECT